MLELRALSGSQEKESTKPSECEREKEWLKGIWVCLTRKERKKLIIREGK